MSMRPFPHDIDLTAPDGVTNLIEFHSAFFGNAQMSDTISDSVTVTNPPAPVDAPTVDDFLKRPEVMAFIEKVRKEEKDKLYPQMDTLKNEVANLTEAQKKSQAEREAAVAAAAAEAQKKAEDEAAHRFAEMDSKGQIAELDKKWAAQLEAERAERVKIESQLHLEREAMSKEKAFLDLATYAQDKVRAAVDNHEIPPQMSAFVVGNTAEEVDASLEDVKGRWAEMAGSIKDAMTTQPAPRGVSATGYAPVGPLDQQDNTRTLTAEQIRDMPMSEYAKYRAQWGINEAGSSRGLFG